MSAISDDIYTKDECIFFLGAGGKINPRTMEPLEYPDPVYKNIYRQSYNYPEIKKYIQYFVQNSAKISKFNIIKITETDDIPIYQVEIIRDNKKFNLNLPLYKIYNYFKHISPKQIKEFIKDLRDFYDENIEGIKLINILPITENTAVLIPEEKLDQYESDIFINFYVPERKYLVNIIRKDKKSYLVYFTIEELEKYKNKLDQDSYYLIYDKIKSSSKIWNNYNENIEDLEIWNLSYTDIVNLYRNIFPDSEKIFKSVSNKRFILEYNYTKDILNEILQTLNYNIIQRLYDKIAIERHYGVRYDRYGRPITMPKSYMINTIIAETLLNLNKK